MLLLYHLCDDRGIDCKPIYIPLCFYFIKVWWKAAQDVGNYLHSTMLLLYRSGSICGPMTATTFTFHYASTLSRRGSAQVKEHFSFTFHYASTLSERSQPPAGARVYIYIPLCFYFIDKECHERLKIVLIYIPLCFYFIRKYNLCIRIHLSQFTFHYASTLSKAAGGRNDRAVNLHSTMLLLYHEED